MKEPGLEEIGQMTSRIRRAPLASVLLQVLVGCLLASGAQARSEILRWTHPSPASVRSFEARYGTSSSSLGQSVNLGKPVPDASGIYSASIQVPGDQDVYVAVRAIGTDDSQSPLSAARLRRAPPSISESTIGFDFDLDPEGTAVAGWLDTAANFSLSVDEGLFGVASDGSGGGALMTTSGANDIHSHMIPAPATPQNYRLRGTLGYSGGDPGLGVTFYSDYVDSDRYYRLGRASGGRFQLETRPGTLACSSLDTGVQPTSGNLYGFEIVVESLSSSNRVRAKVWNVAGNEPESVQIDCVDNRTNRPPGGTFGVWASGSGTKVWDDLVFEVLPAPSESGLPVGPIEAPVLIDIVPVDG
jgi:hypothetical protein